MRPVTIQKELDEVDIAILNALKAGHQSKNLEIILRKQHGLEVSVGNIHFRVRKLKEYYNVKTLFQLSYHLTKKRIIEDHPMVLMIHEYNWEEVDLAILQLLKKGYQSKELREKLEEEYEIKTSIGNIHARVKKIKAYYAVSTLFQLSHILTRRKIIE